MPSSNFVCLLALSFASVGTTIAQSPTLQFSETPAPFKGSKITVNSVAYSGDGKHLAGGSQDKSVYVWNANNGKLIHTMDGHKGPVTAIDYNPIAPIVASGSYNDEFVRIWNTSTGQEVRSIKAHGDVISLKFSGNGKYLATSGGVPDNHRDGTIKLWNAADGTLKRKVFGAEINKYHPSSLAFSPDSKYLACGFSNEKRCVKIWDVESGELVRTIEHVSDVTGIAYSPDGKLIAGGGIDKIVYVWDASSGKVLQKMSGHVGYIGSVNFSPDGNYLASCGMDRASKFKLWKVADGSLIQSMDRRCGDVNSIEFSPDGQALAIGVTTYGDLFSVATVEVYRTAEGVNSSAWPEVKLRPTTISAAFPAQPEYTERTSGAYTYYRQLLTHGYYVYDINIVEYPRAPATVADRTKQCVGMADRYRTSRNATIVSEKDFKYEGEKGKDYVMTSEDKRYRYRIVMKGRHMYQISFLSRNKETCAEEEKFMKSFGGEVAASSLTTTGTDDRVPASATLTPIDDSNAGFKVTFYARPATSRKTNDDKTVTTTYEANFDGMSFRASSIDFSAANYNVTDEQMIDLMAKDFIKRAKATAKSQTNVEQNGGKGRDYVLVSGSTRIRYKVIIKGKKLYQVTCASKNSTENARERAFYKSFVLLD